MATGRGVQTPLDAKLTYAMQMSVDGFVADARGSFDWRLRMKRCTGSSMTSREPRGRLLLGRRMYDVLSAWEDPAIASGEPECIADFQKIWLAAEKVVHSAAAPS